MTTTKPKTTRRILSALAAAVALIAFTERAEAQEVLLTGPLAGAPAVRKLRLYRQGRFEFAPTFTFTLLDEYQRTMLLGARLNYNITDWLAIGGWGAYGLIKLPTSLSDEIQAVNAQRRQADADAEAAGQPRSLSGRLTAVNLGSNFEDQIADINWIAAPQVTVVPFRGKLALFQSIFVDTDLYFFGGPAFIGLEERGDCGGDGTPCAQSFTRATRTAIAPTFGLGFTFFMAKWAALGFEWRGLPFSMNTGGFDTAGGGKDAEFPDDQINADDRRFRFNQLLTVSFNVYLPTQYRVSE